MTHSTHFNMRTLRTIMVAFLTCITLVWSPSAHAADDTVDDQIGLLSGEERAALVEDLQELGNEKNAHFAVVIIDQPQDTIEGFVDGWLSEHAASIGDDDIVLFALATESRQMRVHMIGTIEQNTPNSAMNNAMAAARDYFREGDWAVGFRAYTETMMFESGSGSDGEPSGSAPTYPREGSGSQPASRPQRANVDSSDTFARDTVVLGALTGVTGVVTAGAFSAVARRRMVNMGIEKHARENIVIGSERVYRDDEYLLASGIFGTGEVMRHRDYTDPSSVATYGTWEGDSFESRSSDYILRKMGLREEDTSSGSYSGVGSASWLDSSDSSWGGSSGSSWGGSSGSSWGGSSGSSGSSGGRGSTSSF